MTLEEKIRERVNSGENLDSIMEEIANKIEQEKKEVGSREKYIKELENKFQENGSKAIESLLDTAMELHSFLEDLFR